MFCSSNASLAAANIVLSIVLFPVLGIAAEPARYIGSDESTGTSSSVLVADQPLAHTSQILPVNDAGEIVSVEAVGQINHVLRRLDQLLATANSDIQRVVKLNVYITRADLAEDVYHALADQFNGSRKPALMLMVSKLPHPRALIAVDAVAETTDTGADLVRQTAATASGASVSTLPEGRRIYVSGQAERHESLAEATRGTLVSLRSTLEFLGRGVEDVVQLKAFLTPMTDVDVVREEVREFYAPGPAPPVVFVEWNSSLNTPIEIELVAWGGREKVEDRVEYPTPSGMTASPVFSRVARINHGPTIYISGLSAAVEAGPDEPAGAEEQVREVFASLIDVLEASGSDLRHLVKATYYVRTDAVHSKMGELRPEYYDPLRPPAASLARVSELETPMRGLTLDMIAVPGGGESGGQ